MTVIAWDGTTLAADRMAVNSGRKYSVTKIFRAGGCLVGTSGNSARGRQMLAWFAAGCTPDNFPAPAGDEYATLLVIRPDRTIERYENCPTPITVEDRQHATGSGCDFAQMAMRLGLSAREAVSETCELSSECGLGVDAMTFDN